MHQRLRPLATSVGAVLLFATFGSASLADEQAVNSLRHHSAEPAAWQDPVMTAQLVPPPPRDPVVPNTAVPTNVPAPATTTPPATVVPPSTLELQTPLLDGNLPTEELIPPVVAEGCCDGAARRGVQPYGGGHPTDWSWGCGGSPYRTGPGLCDNWKVGPRWHITVDGLVLHRDDTDLAALTGQMIVNDPTTATGIPQTEQFNYGPGARLSFTSQVGPCSRYDIQVVYEGVNNWDSWIVFPKQSLPPEFYTPVATTTSVNNVATTQTGAAPNTTTVTTTTTSSSTSYAPGPLPLQPPSPFPEGFEQRSLHYVSTLNSIELNWLPFNRSEWRLTLGPRYIRVDDKISDSVNQEVQTPLPFQGADPDVGQFLGVAETDRFNQFHLDNNLMGFQLGLFHDTIQLNERFAIEGFANGGVYYNKVKYSNVMTIRTTQFVTDDTATTGFNETRIDESTAQNNDSRDLDEISYQAEASLTGVCRLNKCWALRAGYQVLWINNLHMADSAYLGNPETQTDLLFHGWHAGVECRR